MRGAEERVQLSTLRGFSEKIGEKKKKEEKINNIDFHIVPPSVFFIRNLINICFKDLDTI